MLAHSQRKDIDIFAFQSEDTIFSHVFRFSTVGKKHVFH